MILINKMEWSYSNFYSCAFAKGKVDNWFYAKQAWQGVDWQGVFSPSVTSKCTRSTYAWWLCVDEASWPWGLFCFPDERQRPHGLWVLTGPFKVPQHASCCLHLHSFVCLKCLFLQLFCRPFPTLCSLFLFGPLLPLLWHRSYPPLTTVTDALVLAPTRLWASWRKRLNLINHFCISCSVLNKSLRILIEFVWVEGNIVP